MNCIYHPDLRAVTSIYSCAHDWERVGLCKSCTERLHPFGRAYATGTGPQAHAEAQEAKRYAEDYDRARPTKERR
jgi:hypothetical protein